MEYCKNIILRNHDLGLSNGIVLVPQHEGFKANVILNDDARRKTLRQTVHYEINTFLYILWLFIGGKSEFLNNFSRF